MGIVKLAGKAVAVVLVGSAMILTIVVILSPFF